MKPGHPVEPDERLSRVLQGWKMEAALPPRFERHVWQRIAQAELAAEPRSLWPMVVALAQRCLAKPVVALGLATALLLLASGAGLWQAQQRTARWDDELGLRYVQSISPYLPK